VYNDDIIHQYRDTPMTVKTLAASPEDILYGARSAAQAASDKSELAQTSWYPCGFAAIRITPARGKFASYLKQNKIGYAGYGGGWSISSYNLAQQTDKWSQSMNVKTDACNAACRVLRSFGINASVETMID
jgi:hypothetical protein